MQAFNKFKTEFCRHLPQLCNATNTIIEQYNRLCRGEFDVNPTISLGQMKQHTHGFSFKSGMEATDFYKIIDRLCICDRWINMSSKWHICYKYCLPGGETCMVIFLDDTIQTIHTQDNGTIPIYLKYNCKCPNSITSYNLCLNLSKTSVIPNPPLIRSYDRVEIHVSKEYHIPSTNNKNIIWKYKATKIWKGSTLKEAETNLQNDIPIYDITCGIVSCPELLSEKQKYLLIAGLLLKMEDLIYYPICEKMHHDISAPPPFFHVLYGS